MSVNIRVPTKKMDKLADAATLAAKPDEDHEIQLSWDGMQRCSG